MVAGTLAVRRFRRGALIAAKGLAVRNLAIACGMLTLVRHGSIRIAHVSLQQVYLT
jgi:hypothetical protein